MKKLILCLLMLPLFSAGQIITTLPSFDSAGTVPFETPMGLASDGHGNFYIADFNFNEILKRDPSGSVTVVAGNNTIGFSGDGGPAIDAVLDGPTCIILDKTGNLYFTDAFAQVVRKIDTAGIITTVAGTGAAFSFGGYSGDDGPADSAQMSFPIAIAFDKTGNLFIADNNNNVIRKVDTNGIITTVVGYMNSAGVGIAGYGGDDGPADSALLSAPIGVMFDAAGNLYITDEGNNVIRKVDTAGIITTFAGNTTGGYSGDGGPATAAQLHFPQNNAAYDSLGNIYFSDAGNNVIRVVSPAGIINTYAGNGTGGHNGDNGPAKFAQCFGPGQISLDAAGNMYFVEGGNQDIRKISGISGTVFICTGDTSDLRTIVSGGSWYSLNNAIASVTASGLVTGVSGGTTQVGYVTGTDTAATTVVVNSVPYAGVITGADSICLAVTNDTLSDTTVGGYWSTTGTNINMFGGSTIFASAGGVDTIFYTVAYTCGIATDTFVLTVIDADPCCISGSDTVCQGDTVMLTHMGTPGGTWSIEDSTAATVLSPGVVKGLLPGEDFVIYTVDGHLPGCVLSSSFTLEVMPSSYCWPEGVPETHITNGAVNIFPDPAIATLNITSNEQIKDVVITNYLGQEVYRKTFSGQQVSIDVSSLPAGVYVALINGGVWRKFVKE